MQKSPDNTTMATKQLNSNKKKKSAKKSGKKSTVASADLGNSEEVKADKQAVAKVIDQRSFKTPKKLNEGGLSSSVDFKREGDDDNLSEDGSPD